MKVYQKLRRVCRTCEAFYRPTGKGQSNCEKCKRINFERGLAKRRKMWADGVTGRLYLREQKDINRGVA